MSREELLKLSDEEFMLKAKEEKISPLINAGFIGFLGGIILYSVIKNTWGLLWIYCALAQSIFQKIWI